MKNAMQTATTETTPSGVPIPTGETLDVLIRFIDAYLLAARVTRARKDAAQG
jgi:hypothetical protein